MSKGSRWRPSSVAHSPALSARRPTEDRRLSVSIPSSARAAPIRRAWLRCPSVTMKRWPRHCSKRRGGDLSRHVRRLRFGGSSGSKALSRSDSGLVLRGAWWAPLGCDGLYRVTRIFTPSSFQLPDAGHAAQSGCFERSQCVPMPSAFADRAKVASAVATRNPSDAATAR